MYKIMRQEYIGGAVRGSIDGAVWGYWRIP